ncbi:MAG: hypothetical protein RDU13_04510 [Elusimicrobiales bacterium]|nr:hypothetical protein [Elusimicrobiales bacterium]
MFKGRTATFAGLVNRVTSLVAGTVATLAVWRLIANQKPPAMEDRFGLAGIFIAIYSMGRAGKKRACELARSNEIGPEKDGEVCEPGCAADGAPAKQTSALDGKQEGRGAEPAAFFRPGPPGSGPPTAPSPPQAPIFP